jgi:hypothetical protein
MDNASLNLNDRYQSPSELFGVQHWDEMSESGIMRRTQYRYSQEQDEMVLDSIFKLLEQPQSQVTLGLSKPNGTKHGHLGEAIIAAKICHKILQHVPNTKLRMLVAYDPPQTKCFLQLQSWLDMVQKETGVKIEFGKRTAEEVDVWFV